MKSSIDGKNLQIEVHPDRADFLDDPVSEAIYEDGPIPGESNHPPKNNPSGGMSGRHLAGTEPDIFPSSMLLGLLPDKTQVRQLLYRR
jgi:hypothetical protein